MFKSSLLILPLRGRCVHIPTRKKPADLAGRVTKKTTLVRAEGGLRVARLRSHRSWRAIISLPQSSGRPNPVEIDRTERIRVSLGDSWLVEDFEPVRSISTNLGAQKIVVG